MKTLPRLCVALALMHLSATALLAQKVGKVYYRLLAVTSKDL